MSKQAFWQKWSGMDRAGWHAVLSSRLHGLWRLLAMPAVRWGIRWLGRGVVAAYFLFVALILVLRYFILPGVAGHQAEIEQAASSAIGMPVRMERLAASWEGLNPRLTLEGVRLLDAKGRPALAFNRVEGVLSWQSLWRFKPILSLLAIDGPVLHVRRDAAGRITVAGLETEGSSDRRLGDWFFDQRRIRIRDATIVWEDAKRQASPLILEDLQFVLDNRGNRHRFGLSAVPPARLASRLDLRGDLKGNPMDGFEQLSGRVFAELDYADLAGWRAWVDYPVRLDQGHGALRIWGDWKAGEGSLVADVALEDVRVQLGRDVPQLDLASMRGRLEGQYRPDQWVLGGQKVELSTLSGIRVPPTDFHFDWHRASDRNGQVKLSGKAMANYVDLAAVQQLAGHLPLDARSRELLRRHQPGGRIADLHAAWEMEGEQLKRYDLRARFEGLGMRPAGYFPGGSNLSGEVEANEKGGKLLLQSKQAALNLPSVFPEPEIPLAELSARANWKVAGSAVEVRLDRFDFSSADGSGSVRGNYRYTGTGPGTIDLTGGLTRAEGRSIWRYMPHAVSPEARAWLKRGITAGAASEVKLALKGDLQEFPFVDKRKGEFLITVKAKGVGIDYAPGWPAISGAEADLSFGAGMQVKVHQGHILGTRMGPVTVEVPSFLAADEHLLVDGRVEGPTSEFLRFIEKSPVAQSINSMTSDMRAIGEGRLALKLDFPLRHIADTRVAGEYELLNNRVTAVPGLPVVNQVSGRIAFTENSVTAPEISGQVLGAPLKLSIRNQGEAVAVDLSGGMVMREMRKLADLPVFDYLSGQTAWKGTVKMQKNTAAFVIETNLAGIASSLPEPLNKSAMAAWPLRIEKGAALPAEGPGRDRLQVSLRNVAEAVLVRRKTAANTLVVEKGTVGIGGAAPAMPSQGVSVALRALRFDADFWRRLLTARNGQDDSASAALSRLALKTPSLRLMGRDFNQVDLDAVKQGSAWKIALNAEEANGELIWQSAGKGVLQADLKRLSIPSGASGPGGAVDEAVTESLPGLDIRVADFSLGNKRLGELRTKAHNLRGTWYLDSLALVNADGSLKGKGEWSLAGGNRTRLNFEMAAGDIGKLLDRLKVPVAVRRGTASMKGELAWEGPLTSIHYPSLNGELLVKAEKGQFTKLEPGIGKLLGLISLQSLPRRLSLDFRDIFSEGLAFDTIEGKLAIRNGVMRTTEDLRIDGPAARILIKGETDLKAETEELTVTVQPEMGGVAAVGVGAAMVNPLVGAGVWVANKVLQNPINRIFSYQYRVTGTWGDPKVEKVGQTNVPAAPLIDSGGPPRPAGEAR